MNKKIDTLKELTDKPSRIAIFSHSNPDGDALGSGTAWMNILTKLGHDVKFFVPNSYPSFMEWINTELGPIDIFTATDDHKDFIDEADIFFFLDMNNISRIDGLSDYIVRNTNAKKILIDHHPQPANIFDLEFSFPDSSSTSLIIYKIIAACGYEDLIDTAIATGLYVGMSTDTGNFTFGNLDPELYNAVANLAGNGIDIAELNIRLYNIYSKDRMRLLGHLLDKRMVFVDNSDAAYIYISKADQSDFNFRQGDSEGFVNIPLNIDGINISALFIQTNECIKISLRSKGEIDVNRMAREYFNGGGHKNASGGKFYKGMDNAIDTFIEAIRKL
ncbi:MAG: bifunctional oligoribonuclease/PAP phosphatase NrnA [Rikenellaceae bacterium]|nr:bifunctional oligoribonuclease/PAP phosphatase NrnA [Rikenellaceae bacterium]